MAPSINDVSTDLDSPPKFRLADIGDMPAENMAAIREHYADLAPVEYEGASSLRRLSHPICPLNKLSRPRLSTLLPEARCMTATGKSAATVWAAALAVAQRTPRWHITEADEPRYIEGVATTLVMRFKARAERSAPRPLQSGLCARVTRRVASFYCQAFAACITRQSNGHARRQDASACTVQPTRVRVACLGAQKHGTAYPLLRCCVSANP